MKDDQFNDLKNADKAWLLNEYADHLLSIEHYDHRIHLYSLHSSFIEVYCHIESKRIEKIVIATYSDLDKYLSRIFIASLKAKAKH